ncbi:hypothetical protein J6590_106345, partial [Homalodisca vitripennis]
MSRYVTRQMSRDRHTVHTATDICQILGHCFCSVSRFSWQVVRGAIARLLKMCLGCMTAIVVRVVKRNTHA